MSKLKAMERLRRRSGISYKDVRSRWYRLKRIKWRSKLVGK